MKIVGLTGGIGSGKTTVANFFRKLNVPVYIADDEAKMLMNTSKILIRKIKKLFGEKAYKNNELNRPFIASRIFNDKTLLNEMNKIVHPKVGKHFKNWLAKQEHPYIIKEAAILFESGSYMECDCIISVVADRDTRIKRLLQRNSTTKKKIKSIMNNQWTDEDRIKLSDFVIHNMELKNTKKQVLAIHKKLLKLSE